MRPAIVRHAERALLALDAAIGLPAPFPGAYMDTWMSAARARALISATRVGVFDALPGTTQELADRTATDPERLAVLLDALRALRYVKARRDIWLPTRRARASLLENAPLPLRETVRSLATSSWDVLSGWEDVLRGGPPPGLHDGAANAEEWRGYQAAMVELNGLVAAQVLDLVATAPRRLLDIGGGPASFAVAACRRWSDCDVVVADYAEAVAPGLQRVATAGLEGRVTYVAGDARTTALGNGYDLATLLQVLHSNDRDGCVALLRRAAEAAAGGEVLVLDMDGASTQAAALASLTFCAWMGRRTYSGDELLAMAREAGLEGPRLRRPARLAGSVVLMARAPR